MLFRWITVPKIVGLFSGPNLLGLSDGLNRNWLWVAQGLGPPGQRQIGESEIPLPERIEATFLYLHKIGLPQTRKLSTPRY